MNKKDFINKVFITKSSEETRELGYGFAKTLKKGDTVCLYGDLGSGKTTFVQGLAGGIGIKRRITSPTFIIVRSYKVENKNVILASEARPKSKIDPGQARMTNSSLLVFYHIDLYRIENERDLKGLGLEEIINNKNNIVAIEWAEKAKNILSGKKIDIKFSYGKNDTRKIEFSLTT